MLLLSNKLVEVALICDRIHTLTTIFDQNYQDD